MAGQSNIRVQVTRRSNEDASSSVVVALIGSARFIREKALDARAVLGLAIGGIPAVLIAAFIVKTMPLTYVRWMVVIVVVYAALMMLRSAMTERSMPIKAGA